MDLKEFNAKVLADIDQIMESFHYDQQPPLMAEYLEKLPDSRCHVYAMTTKNPKGIQQIQSYWYCQKETFGSVLSIMNMDEIPTTEEVEAFILWVRNGVIVGIHLCSIFQFIEFCSIMPKADWIRTYRFF